MELTVGQRFFHHQFPSVLFEWARDRDLSFEQIQLTANLKNGESFPFTGFRTTASDWVVFFTEEDEMKFAPMGLVATITVERLPKPRDMKVGFVHGPIENEPDEADRE